MKKIFCILATLFAATALSAQNRCVTDGYDVRLRSETDEVWNFRCTKSRTNKDKDDPRTMDLVVAKGSYMPVSLKATMKGVTVTLRDFAVGITEEDVTFDASKFPNIKIVDLR